MSVIVERRILCDLCGAETDQYKGEHRLGRAWPEPIVPQPPAGFYVSLGGGSAWDLCGECVEPVRAAMHKRMAESKEGREET